MSLKNGVWHDALLDPPKESELVLCVKENQKGHRNLCFGSYWPERYHDDRYDDRWVTSGGCRNIIWWMPLPKVPEPGEILQQKREIDQMERNLKDCVNELCLKCGNYHEAYVGACDGCRWKTVKEGFR